MDCLSLTVKASLLRSRSKAQNTSLNRLICASERRTLRFRSAAQSPYKPRHNLSKRNNDDYLPERWPVLKVPEWWPPSNVQTSSFPVRKARYQTPGGSIFSSSSPVCRTQVGRPHRGQTGPAPRNADVFQPRPIPELQFRDVLRGQRS